MFGKENAHGRLLSDFFLEEIFPFEKHKLLSMILGPKSAFLYEELKVSTYQQTCIWKIAK